MIKLFIRNYAISAAKPSIKKPLFKSSTKRPIVTKPKIVSSSTDKPIVKTETIQTGTIKSEDPKISKPASSQTGLGGKTFGDIFNKSLNDKNELENDLNQDQDWINSFPGIGTSKLSSQQIDTLLQPLEPEDIEIKPDGLLYLPEIKYRRILNKAFGPGAWGLIPRTETIITPKLITREYGLVVMGKLIGVARGEQDYFNENGIPTATEGCKSNALMRCCKDLGIASELWDPRFIRKFKKQYCEGVFAKHVTTGKAKKIWKRKDDEVPYPYKI